MQQQENQPVVGHEKCQTTQIYLATNYHMPRVGQGNIKKKSQMKVMARTSCCMSEGKKVMISTR